MWWRVGPEMKERPASDLCVRVSLCTRYFSTWYSNDRLLRMQSRTMSGRVEAEIGGNRVYSWFDKSCRVARQIGPPPFEKKFRVRSAWRQLGQLSVMNYSLSWTQSWQFFMRGICRLIWFWWRKQRLVVMTGKVAIWWTWRMICSTIDRVLEYEHRYRLSRLLWGVLVRI